MKVIFLDVDGVLINRRVLMAKHGKVRGFDRIDCAARECVNELNRILEETGAKIVVSSTWRMGRTIPELQELMDRWEVKGEVIDKTIVDWDVVRGIEIQDWLTKHQHQVDKFVILDDDADMAHLKKDLVQTKFELGLCSWDADKAIEKLGGKNVHSVVSPSPSSGSSGS